MKTSTVFILAFLLATGTLIGRIRNGYEQQLDDSRTSLRRLLLLKNTDLSSVQRHKVNSAIKNIVSYITRYELTEELLEQLRLISPDLYHEIDHLKDKQGRPVDVYVKLIPQEQSLLSFQGATFFSQAPDEDAHFSEYGKHSVSVKIWIVSDALKLLYHELGHVQYVVPNLASYARFYQRHYHNMASEINTAQIGHSADDAGGRLASAYEIRLRRDYGQYLKNGGRPLPTAIALLQRINKENKDLALIAFSPDLARGRNYPFQGIDLSRFP